MKKFLSSAGLAVVLATSAVIGSAPLAMAQGLQLEIGPDGVRPIDPDRDGDRDRNRDREARNGGCSERQARAAARDEGLRNAQVIRTTSRSITVEGDTRRGPETMRFANRPGCPEI